MAYVQVHRFRSAVALAAGKGETIYLTPKDARRIARALNAAARSCDREPFHESTVGTFSAQCADGRKES